MSSTPIKLSEQSVINAIVRTHWSTSICIQRFTPKGWWECDVFMMTKSNYFYEYEIKLSRQDFLKDKFKERKKYEWGKSGTFNVSTLKKHNMLLNRDTKGPSVFYYVVPAGMIKMNEVPEYAGLIEIIQNDWGISFSNAIKAPRLHSVKTDETVRDDIMRTCYFRMHQYLQSMPKGS